jgi:hypothetical protein
MKMLYGVNQADRCWDFARGPEARRIQQRLRDVGTRLVRLFLFDKAAADPVWQWPDFASYVQAVLDVGATPMITFARMSRPLDDPRAVRTFAARCADVVWGCIDQWGGEAVRDWYWCVWNEPNNAWISGPVTFEQYRRVYEEVAHALLRWLGPHLNGRKPRIGGPAIEGFQPFWWDWAWRFIHEIDNRLIGFLDWHRYGDWRECGEKGAPADEAAYRRLIMSVTHDYELRARAVARLVTGRDVLNVCGELNAHSHYTRPVRTRFNRTVFAATFYAAALLNLMRGGADAEMFWTGTEDLGGYGMINENGEPFPVFHAKRLCACHVRYGDWITFPLDGRGPQDVDVVLAAGADGRRSALFVHLADKAATYAVADLTGSRALYQRLLKIDEAGGDGLVDQAFDGTVAFDGYGVAVVTTEEPTA